MAEITTRPFCQVSEEQWLGEQFNLSLNPEVPQLELQRFVVHGHERDLTVGCYCWAQYPD